MFIGVNYIVFESPKCDNPTAVFPTAENRTQVSNNIINNQSNKDNSKIEFFNDNFLNYSSNFLEKAHHGRSIC